MSHLTSKYKSTPTISFKGRHQQVTSSNRIQNIPSPQQYKIDYYDMAKNIKTAVKFTKQKRSCSFDNSKEMPGPGYYEAMPSKNLVSFNKGQFLKKGQQRFWSERKGLTPAPGTYNAHQKRYSSPEFSIGKLKRSLKQLSSANNNPAPNTYSPKRSPQQPAISVSFARSQRKINIKNDKSPGPGLYQLQRPFLSTSFNQKREIFPKAARVSSSTIAVIPGPGAYPTLSPFSEEQLTKRGFTWQKSHRSSRSVSDGPGPGLYNSESLIHKFRRHSGVTIAQSKREDLFLRDLRRSASTPGPGQHQSSFEGSSKFKSISSSKFPKAKLPRFLKPAPNNFDFINPEKLNCTKTASPCFSIKTSRRRDIFEETLKRSISDKFYDSNISITRKSDNNAHKIPRALRLKPNIDTRVGPGYYNPETDFLPNKKMKFSKQKRSSFVDEIVKRKLSTFLGETYEDREQFPNPPKYMNVYKKLQINQRKISGY